MKTSFQIHTSSDSLSNDLSLIYFDQAYLKNQSLDQLVCYENARYLFPVSIETNLAISIPRSPFGSFLCKDTPSKEEFLELLKLAEDDLQKRGIKKLLVKHPSPIYAQIASLDWLSGFDVEFADINQHILLQDGWGNSIHTMQKRKLDSLRAGQFEFRKMEMNELETAHKFISVCRQAQDLEINISYELLKQLSESTKAYDIFCVVRDGKISALCIAVRPTSKVAYYYLPATSPLFRNQSPMVLLIAGMIDYYKSIGFEYLDMGVSSIEGKPQESLRIFKERMGAVETVKPMLVRHL